MMIPLIQKITDTTKHIKVGNVMFSPFKQLISSFPMTFHNDGTVFSVTCCVDNFSSEG